MLPPGLGFCALSEQGVGEDQDRSTLPKYYLDLRRRAQVRWPRTRRTSRRPSSIVVGLRAVAPDAGARGPGRTSSSATTGSRAPRARGVEALGLELVRAGRRRARRVTAVAAPPRRRTASRSSACYSQRHNITIAGGQGEMKGQLFRLGHMGYAAEFDVIVGAARRSSRCSPTSASPWTSAPGCAARRKSSPRSREARSRHRRPRFGRCRRASASTGSTSTSSARWTSATLAARLGEYEGLIVRSATKVTRATLEAAGRPGGHRPGRGRGRHDRRGRRRPSAASS